jgi:hypothetical protein
MLTSDVCLADLASFDYSKVIIEQRWSQRTYKGHFYNAYPDVKGAKGGLKWIRTPEKFIAMMLERTKAAGTRKRAVSDSGAEPAAAAKAKVARVDTPKTAPSTTPSKATTSTTAYSEESSEATSSEESSEATPKATPKATSEAKDSSEGTATSKDAPICHDPGLLSATSDFTTAEHQQQAKPNQLLSSDCLVRGHYVGEDA